MFTTFSCLAGIAVMLPGVLGHSMMLKPAPGWTVPYPSNSFSATIDGYAALPIDDKSGYSGGQQTNVDNYRKAFEASDYTSLKDLIMKNQKVTGGASPECGLTKFGDPSPLGSTVEWAELTHVGPMEIWCGDNIIYYESNAGDKSTDGKNTDGIFKIDPSKCAGETQLVSYWLAIHTAEWQVYIDCATITTSGAPASQAATDTDIDTPSVTPSPAEQYTQAPVTQAPVTKAPVTQPPVTQGLTLPNAGSSCKRSTKKPRTQPPVTTSAPVTQAPPQQEPETSAPATDSPATVSPPDLLNEYENPTTTKPPPISQAVVTPPTASGDAFFTLDCEDEAVGSQPGGEWTNFISYQPNKADNTESSASFIVVSSGEAHSGTKSLHIKTTGQEPAQIAHKLPASDTVYMRVWIKTDHKMGGVTGDNHEHFMGVRATNDVNSANNEVRVGSGKGALGFNQMPTDAISPIYEKWFSGPSTPVGEWYCVEAGFNKGAAYNSLEMWVNGELVNSVTKAEDWHSPVPADWLSSQMNYAFFGWQSYSGNGIEMWMDDIVVASSKIGC